ncbi:MAG: hypothetical protein RL189_888 [Pseudomonadota bacterium]
MFVVSEKGCSVSERTLFSSFLTKSFISSNVPHPKTKIGKSQKPKKQRCNGRDSGEEDATEPDVIVRARRLSVQSRREQAAVGRVIPVAASTHGAGGSTKQLT